MIRGRSISARTTSTSLTTCISEKEKEFSNLLDFSSLDKITHSLLATMQIFHQEAQILAQKMGFEYDREVAEKMIQYAESKLPNY